jgi:phosphinothricin acetyltransferase
MADVIVRCADSRDIPAITQIYAHAVLTGTASFEIDPPDEAEMTRRYAKLREADYPYLVAEADHVIGYACAGPYRDRPAYRWCVEDSVYIAPHAHRRGVGRALLARLIDAAERRSFRQMIAVIGDSANVSSIELHRALGFRHIGTLAAVGFKHGRWLDSVLMQRALGLGDATVP